MLSVMFTRIGLAALAVMASVSLASCGASAEAPPVPIESGTAHHRLVGPADFAAAVGEADTLTINVHVPYEGDIAGTDLSIPFDRIAEQSDLLPKDHDAPIAIYCRSGPMSATAAATLTSMGYTDVVELDGGMRAWQASGRPLIGN